MTEPKDTAPPNKRWFNQHAPAPFGTNRRLGVRFVRNDIIVTLWKAGTLSVAFKSMRRERSVKLVDISSRGVLVESTFRLNVNKKVLLTLSFVDGFTFQLLSTVVRKDAANIHRYGIKFDKANHHLAEHLLKSQKILTFR
jgi:PilZ domain